MYSITGLGSKYLIDMSRFTNSLERQKGGCINHLQIIRNVWTGYIVVEKVLPYLGRANIIVYQLLYNHYVHLQLSFSSLDVGSLMHYNETYSM
jgi:hypothetical protein